MKREICRKIYKNRKIVTKTVIEKQNILIFLEIYIFASNFFGGKNVGIDNLESKTYFSNNCVALLSRLDNSRKKFPFVCLPRESYIRGIYDRDGWLSRGMGG